MAKNIAQDTLINQCKQTLLAFINECYQYNKLYDYTDNSNESKQKMLKIMKTYTTDRQSYRFKSIIHDAKDIKEVDIVEFISNRKLRILTKKNRSTVPVCEFYMIKKKRAWVIESFRIQKGVNSFYEIFPNKADYYLD